MSINFEAANMAGYNNPKIEVFKAHSSDSTTLDEAPTKTDLLNCTRRGSVPFIMLNNSDAFHILLPLCGILYDAESSGTMIAFGFEGSVLEGSHLEVHLIYPLDDKPPLFTYTET